MLQHAVDVLSRPALEYETFFTPDDFVHELSSGLLLFGWSVESITDPVRGRAVALPEVGD
jgi:hypothetical protein